jgi:mannose-1-phosphate guanylyltransferase
MFGVILAGGVGTRLWPRSRTAQPKQFVDIIGNGRTLIQATTDRIRGLIVPEQMYVITGAQYAGLATEQLPEIPPDQIVAEPSGRNTGPAIGLACVHIMRRDPNGIVAIMHSDHAIADSDQFRTTLARAADGAREGYIVTLGIHPTSPHTGFGYIKCGSQLSIGSSSSLPIHSVEGFVEKPDLETADRFLASGNYYWNGGFFISRVDRMMAEFERQLPQVYAQLAAIERGLDQGYRMGHPILDLAWDAMPNISIDHGIMEGAANVAVVPLHAGWNDIGSWDALEAILQRDDTGNLVVKGNISAVDSQRNIVYSEKQIVALVGVEDLVVVDTGDTLLVGHKQQMQSVKMLVERLRDQGRNEVL